jgi:superfamily II DNA helicase RecQ
MRNPFTSRGEEFRKDFKDLSAVRAFFPGIPLVALTATAPPYMVDNIKKSLCMVNPKVVSANPNRINIYLNKKIRKANCYGYEGYDNILMPIASELYVQREQYPMTVIYMKLKYCGYVYSLFERVLGDRQYVGETRDPSSRLFVQFHAPQTNLMKKEIIHEMKRKDSRIRVIIATSALGMGVDAPCITHVIHIRPPSNIESYMQEIGRAGRNGLQAWATLYYNNSDVSENKENVSEEMKNYCKSHTICLRKVILEYLGFICRNQEKCCCVCDGHFKGTYEKLPCVTREKVRILPDENKAILRELISVELALHNKQIDSEYGATLFCLPTETDLDKLMEDIESIETESDLLDNHGIWNEICSSCVFKLISDYAPLKDQHKTQ